MIRGKTGNNVKTRRRGGSTMAPSVMWGLATVSDVTSILSWIAVSISLPSPLSPQAQQTRTEEGPQKYVLSRRVFLPAQPAGSSPVFTLDGLLDKSVHRCLPSIPRRYLRSCLSRTRLIISSARRFSLNMANSLLRTLCDGRPLQKKKEAPCEIPGTLHQPRFDSPAQPDIYTAVSVYR